MVDSGLSFLFKLAGEAEIELACIVDIYNRVWYTTAYRLFTLVYVHEICYIVLKYGNLHKSRNCVIIMLWNPSVSQ